MELKGRDRESKGETKMEQRKEGKKEMEDENIFLRLASVLSQTFKHSSNYIEQFL